MWLFLSLFRSPCEADRVEAVEQQGRRKGDSGCLFQVRGQFCSVPLQLEEHLSTLTSANHSSAAPREAYLTEVLLTVFPSRDERRHCHFQNQYSSEEIGRDVVVDTYIITSSFLVLLAGAEGMGQDTLIACGWCQHYLILPPTGILYPTVSFLRV